MKNEVEERRNECNTVSQMAKEAKKTSHDAVSSLHGVCTKYRKTNVVIRKEHKEAKDALLDTF